MRALVTGANGFVGLHLVAHLRSCGDEVIESDTNILDRQAITAMITSAKPDVVYHLAAQADVGGSWDSPVNTLRVNVEGTLNVCDASRLAGAQRVLGITSADVYGHVSQTDPKRSALDETTPLRPVSPYAASKAAAESLYMQAGLGHGLNVVLARSFNHLGPGQSDRFVASAIASRIAANERSGATTVSVWQSRSSPRLHRCTRCRSGLSTADTTRHSRRGIPRLLRSRSRYPRDRRTTRRLGGISHDSRTRPGTAETRRPEGTVRRQHQDSQPHRLGTTNPDRNHSFRLTRILAPKPRRRRDSSTPLRQGSLWPNAR